MEDQNYITEVKHDQFRPGRYTSDAIVKSKSITQKKNHNCSVELCSFRLFLESALQHYNIIKSNLRFPKQARLEVYCVVI